MRWTACITHERKLKQPDTCEDTRGGRQVRETMPDASVLSQLQNNPYAIKDKGVVKAR